MNNVYLGGIGSTKKQLKQYHFFNYDDMKNYFETPQIIKLLNEARNWLDKGSYEQYIKKLNSLKYQKYLERYERMIERITLKMGIDPISARYYMSFGDYMA
jgi:hypothetical protein